MSGINKVILIGRLGNDPHTQTMPNGDTVTKISIATSESWTDKQTGEKKQQTEWHNVVAFRKLAEIMAKYLTKGLQVYIEGKLKTRKWQDQHGQDRYTTEIIADKLEMLGSKDQGETKPNAQAKAETKGSDKGKDWDGYSEQEQFADDDIPF